MSQTAFSRYARALAVGTCALALTAGAATAQDIPDDPALDAAFQAAIKDASVAEPSEIVSDLFAINRYNTALEWQDPETFDKVKVISWMSAGKLGATFPDVAVDSLQPGQTGTAPTTRDIWVSAVPQLKAFCASTGLTGDALQLRLKQYLGLNYTWTYYALAEMWVNPDDLYRPCGDPQIGDSTCALPGTMEGYYGTQPSDAYKTWFDDTEKGSYTPDGAPWTRLGYTYDWGTDVEPHKGGSEYLIARRAPVTLVSLNQPDDYCK